MKLNDSISGFFMVVKQVRERGRERERESYTGFSSGRGLDPIREESRVTSTPDYRVPCVLVSKRMRSHVRYTRRNDVKVPLSRQESGQPINTKDCATGIEFACPAGPTS